MTNSINIDLKQISIDEDGNVLIKNEKLKKALQETTETEALAANIGQCCCGGGTCNDGCSSGSL